MEETSIVEEIKTALEPLANKLGEGGEYVFQLAVKQAYVHAVQNIMLFLAMIVVTVVAVKVIKKLYAKYQTLSSYDKDDWIGVGLFASFLGGVAFFALWVLAFLALKDAVGMLVNPEWYAIKSIAEAVLNTVPK